MNVATRKCSDGSNVASSHTTNVFLLPASIVVCYSLKNKEFEDIQTTLLKDYHAVKHFRLNKNRYS
jgi:hypothetical protein